MSTINITFLRWHGGEGGDTLLKMIIGSNLKLQSNISWEEAVTNGGKTIPIESAINSNFIDLPSIVNIAIGGKHEYVTIDQLNDNVAKLKLLSKNFMLKSHWYQSSIFNDSTIDLVTSSEMLPFVVRANVEKNSKAMQNYSPLREKIKDPALLKAYDLYNVSWSRLHNTFQYSGNQITVDTLLSNWNTLKNKLAEFNLLLDDKYKIYYTNWLDKNQQYLPSNRYKELVNTGNFDYTDSQLSITEKYCLLAMAKKSFTVLH